MALPDYKVDEGYSEAPMDQVGQDSEMIMGQMTDDDAQRQDARDLEAHLLGMSEQGRAEHIYRMLQSLRTSTVAEIVERLTPRLHMDPVVMLPPELTSQVFANLEPEMLVVASTVSKTWRERVLDTSLWRRKFLNEGWYLNIPKVLSFERDHGRAAARKPLSRRAGSDVNRRETKRRVVEPALIRQDTFPSDIANVGSVAGSDVATIVGSVAEKPDAEMTSPSEEQPEPSLQRVDTANSDMSDDLPTPKLPMHARSLMVKTPFGDSRLDYQRLYRVKSHLEENWLQGRYTSFQFPHKDYALEAHTECVYTIQFSDKYLVSGSRDRTIRIWNLETHRLARKPLTGHTGSVLSLQFDESAEEDLIVSGSSDHHIGIWQFSTGKLVKKITDAHTEAVLCVRFDKRYLATCSKDRLIKIFNRKDLKPGDAEYPVRGVPGGGTFPDYVVNMSHFSSVEDFERYLDPELKKPLPPYTLIMTLEHHSAAVNSLHIHNDQLASGSGDRTAKIFNLKTGAIETNCRMHIKGVACIEYDGARLVSGSSDETIRVFDPATNAQVGILNGHTKLVRTIQADFGDAPGSRESLEEDAMLADQAYLDAQVDEMVEDRLARQEGRHRSRRRQSTPLQSAIGAKLPPGGGGNRWSRIVSGSYDETVIVWRREPDGRWAVGQRYKVTDALRAAGPALVATSELVAMQRQRRQRAQQMQILNAAGGTALAAPVNGGNSTPAPAANAAAGAAAATHQGTGAMPAHANGQAGPPQSHQQAAAQTATPTPPPNHGAQQQLPNAPQVPPIPALSVAQHNAAHAAATQAALHAAQQGNARAFKLQFDARRIICCSQDPKIVGWDFADGNSEIIEGAKFFTRTSHYARGG